MIKVEDLLVLLVFGYLRYIWWKRTNHFAGHINGRIQVKVKNKGKKKKNKGEKEWYEPIISSYIIYIHTYVLHH